MNQKSPQSPLSLDKHGTSMQLLYLSCSCSCEMWLLCISGSGSKCCGCKVWGKSYTDKSILGHIRRMLGQCRSNSPIYHHNKCWDFLSISLLFMLTLFILMSNLTRHLLSTISSLYKMWYSFYSRHYYFSEVISIISFCMVAVWRSVLIFNHF